MRRKLKSITQVLYPLPKDTGITGIEVFKSKQMIQKAFFNSSELLR